MLTVQLDDCVCAPVELSFLAQTAAGLALMAPSSNTATCACVGCAANQVSYQNIWYFRTGTCANNPFINAISFQATDAATKFRVFTTRTNSVAAGTYFYGAGSSMKLTADSVTCFNAKFQPGYSNALIATQSATGELFVVLYCDTAAGCNFNWKIEGGCTAATVPPSVSGTAMDSCMSSCNPSGGTCRSGACSCASGFSGARCQTSPNPCASVNCGAHGSCSNGQCSCTDGYTGTTCSVAPQIAPGACPSGQTCTSGKCYTAGGFSTSTSCSCICSNGSMQPVSGATDCDDCTTRCAATSCQSGTSCSTSSSSSSPTATGATCAVSSTGSAPSSADAAAGTSTGAVAYDPTAWLGSYVARNCDTTKCCCATTVAITDSGSTYTVTGTGLQGGCGELTVVTQSFPVPTSNTVSYMFGGQSHTATLGDGIADVNNDAPACTGALTKEARNGARDLAPTWSLGAFLLLTAAAIHVF